MFRCVVSFLLLTSVLLGEEKKVVDEEHLCNWPKEWRQKALIRLDGMIHKAIPLSVRGFCLAAPLVQKEVSVELAALTEFSTQHGYFSCYEPLVGVVTKEEEDCKKVEQVFASLVSMQGGHPLFKEIAVGEMMTKVLAYRNLQKEARLLLPIQKETSFDLVPYYVDQVIDLCMGMPAFCFMPIVPGNPPFLLFRGTDFSFLSKRGWASMLSDLDVTGVGFSVFQSRQSVIRQWLQKAYKEAGAKARVMGFSLGGVLAIYTTLFEGDLIAEKGSMAFNPPGVSEELLQKWKTAGSKEQISLYLTQGDLVCKLGKLIAPSFQLSVKNVLGPIEAHTKIVSADSPFFISNIAYDLENSQRFTMK